MEEGAPADGARFERCPQVVTEVVRLACIQACEFRTHRARACRGFLAGRTDNSPAGDRALRDAAPLPQPDWLDADRRRSAAGLRRPDSACSVQWRRSSGEDAPFLQDDEPTGGPLR